MTQDIETQETTRLQRHAGEDYDLLIVGGGIVGCGAARDAALRGQKAALFEKEDFGYGTSSRSTRLIHGGLRYLEIFDFDLVRQDLREREILLRVAPHRVKPLPFLVPLYNNSLFYRAKIRIGMALYDLLSYDKSLPRHRMLSRRAVLREEPGLSPEGLQGAALYYDAQVALTERLCLDNALDAARHGARLFNHTEVTALVRDETGRVVGVEARDTLSGEEAEFRGRIVIDAAGPWLDRLTGKLGTKSTRYLRLTKGIHFAAPPATNRALVLFSRTDGRLFFVIPWLGYAWVGTTDTDFDADLDAVRATGEDVGYLLKSVEPVLPKGEWDTIYFSNAGVRALVRSDKPNARESDVSRKHKLIVHTAAEGLAGVLSILGGKITAYRDIAREAVETAWLTDTAFRRESGGDVYRAEALPGCRTDALPLPGGDFQDRDALQAQCRRDAAAFGLDDAQADNLVLLYGTAFSDLLGRVKARPELGNRLHPDYPDVVAEVRHAVESEFALSACDILMRRTALFFTPDQGKRAIPAIVEEMGRLLCWTTERCSVETAACERQIALAQQFREELPPS